MAKKQPIQKVTDAKDVDIVDDDPSFDKQDFSFIVESIKSINESEQASQLKAIEADDKDNERRFLFASKEAERADKRWKIAFAVVSIFVFILLVLGVYLVVDGKSDLGFKLITHLATTVLGFIAGFGVAKTKSS